MPDKGSAQLNALGIRLEMIGNQTLRRNVSKAIAMSLKETEGQIKSTANEILPESGGLNKWVSQSPIHQESKQTRQHTFGTWIIQHKDGHSLKDIDRGRIKHPVFGRPESSTIQIIPKGYFTKTIAKNLFRIRNQVHEAAFSVLRGVK